MAFFDTDRSSRAARTGAPRARAAATAGASLTFPVRHSAWVSFGVGASALVVSVLLAALLCTLIALAPARIDGAVLVVLFGGLLFAGFFGSVPLQRRLVRSLDLRRPGVRLADGELTVPVGDGADVRFRLNEPYELAFGWVDEVTVAPNNAAARTRNHLTYALLSQEGRSVLLRAEESARSAKRAHWPYGWYPEAPETVVRMWADDVVALVAAVRKAV